MAREEVKPPRDLSNEHTLVAQKYAGYLVGHSYRNQQQNTVVTVEKKPWREPAIIADDCIFCVRLTDEDAIRRVLGYQYQIDIECTRSKRQYLRAWVESGESEVPQEVVDRGGELLRADAGFSPPNLRRFCELFQDMPTERRPQGWQTRPFPIISLPLRLKRKLCIEWNHIYVRWMATVGVQYDFEKHVFWHEVDNDARRAQEAMTAYMWDYAPPWEGEPSCWD